MLSVVLHHIIADGQSLTVLANEIRAHYRARVTGTRGAELRYRLDVEATTALERFARAHRCTLFHVMLAAFWSLLSGHGAGDDVCVGSPVGGRTRVATFGALAHQDVPFAHVVAALDLPRDPSRMQVFGAILVCATTALFEADTMRAWAAEFEGMLRAGAAGA